MATLLRFPSKPAPVRYHHLDGVPLHQVVRVSASNHRHIRLMRRRVETAHTVFVWACVVAPLAALACAGAWELGRALARAAL